MNILDLFFPKRCVTCGKIGNYFCQSCLFKIEYIKHQVCPVCSENSIDGTTHYKCQKKYSLDGIFALAHFKGPVKNAIHVFKYRLVSDISGYLANLILDNYPSFLPKFDYFIPVPLHGKRMRERGFNQSKLLADQIGRKLDVEVLDNALIRKKATKSQAELEKKERMKNILGAFEWEQKVNLKGKKIGLIDDVSTTFSTVSECCKILKRSGATCVWGIVFAHG
jgi:ComF family protein